MGFWYLRAFGPHPQLHIWIQMTLLNKSIIAKQSSFFFLFYLKCHGHCVCAILEFFSIPKWNDYASVLVPLARGDSLRKLHWEMIHLMARFGKRSSESINLNCGEPTVKANDNASNCKSTVGKSGPFKICSSTFNKDSLFIFTLAKILIVSCDRCRQFRARGRDTAGPHFAFHIAHCF